MDIQFQYADADDRNLGGLYVNVDHISYVRAQRMENQVYWTFIGLTSGKELKIFGDTSTVLDDIYKAQKRKRELS